MTDVSNNDFCCIDERHGTARHGDAIIDDDGVFEWQDEKNTFRARPRPER